MKKILMVIFIISNLLTGVVGAENNDKIIANLVDYKIIYKETEFSFNDAEGKVFPVLIDGTTYLPYDAISKLFGVKISINGSNVYIDSTPAVQVNVFNQSYVFEPTSIYVNRSDEIQVMFDDKKVGFVDSAGNTVYPMYCKGKLYLPIRGVADLLALPIKFSAETGTIYILQLLENI